MRSLSYAILGFGLCTYSVSGLCDMAAASSSVQSSSQVASKESSYDFDSHLTGNVDIVSNYVWRGVTQSNNGPAVQAGVTYTFDSGIYAMFWGSNVNYGDDNDAHLETDYQLGYANKFANGIGYDISAYRYVYPKTNGLNYNEYFLNLSYDIFKATFGYSNDEYATGKSGKYYALAVDYPVPAEFMYGMEGVGVGGSAGYSDLPTEAGNSYMDYRVYLSKQLTKKVKLSLSYTTTNKASPKDEQYYLADLTFSF